MEYSWRLSGAATPATLPQSRCTWPWSRARSWSRWSGFPTSNLDSHTAQVTFIHHLPTVGSLFVFLVIGDYLFFSSKIPSLGLTGNLIARCDDDQCQILFGKPSCRWRASKWDYIVHHCRNAYGDAKFWPNRTSLEKKSSIFPIVLMIKNTLSVFTRGKFLSAFIIIEIS